MLQAQQEALQVYLLSLRAQFACEGCSFGTDTSLEVGLGQLHTGCGFRGWQQAALAWLEGEAMRPVLAGLEAITAYKNTFDCHMCGMCCRMASSESSYEELLAKAGAGDEFARQFTSVFLPYASREAALEKAPDVVAAVLAEAVEPLKLVKSGEHSDGGEERSFFYHCPYIGEDNRCSIYGTDKRPGICASYPETPLSFVYERCAWKPWKDETHAPSLVAHAMLALAANYAERFRQALQTL